MTVQEFAERDAAVRAYEAWMERARDAQAASPAHRGAYLFDEGVDRENCAGYFVDDSAEYWRAMRAAAESAMVDRCDNARLPQLKVPA